MFVVINFRLCLLLRNAIARIFFNFRKAMGTYHSLPAALPTPSVKEIPFVTPLRSISNNISSGSRRSQRWTCMFTLACSRHPRLGAGSPFAQLPEFVLQYICKLAGLGKLHFLTVICCTEIYLYSLPCDNTCHEPIFTLKIKETSSTESALYFLSTTAINCGPLIFFSSNGWRDTHLFSLQEEPPCLIEVSKPWLTDEFVRLVGNDKSHEVCMLGAGSFVALVIFYNVIYIWDIRTHQRVVDGKQWKVCLNANLPETVVQKQMLYTEIAATGQKLLILCSSFVVEVWDLYSGESQGIAFFNHLDRCCVFTEENVKFLAAFSTEKSLYILTLPHLQALKKHYVAFPTITDICSKNRYIVTKHKVGLLPLFA